MVSNLIKAFTGLCLLVQVLGGHYFEDMSHDMDPNGMSYPQVNNYKYEVLHAGPVEGGVEFEAYGNFETTEHHGTHVDAPLHFSEGGKSIDQVPLEDLNGPLVIINIKDRAAQAGDVAQVSVADIQAWEQKYGQIPRGAFVIMWSGWDAYWGDNTKYVGSPFRFPGFSKPAVDWLLANRDINGIGTDTLACESTGNPWEVHTTILPAGKVCIENLRGMGNIPECGARFFALPIMLAGGTGSQARCYAEWRSGFSYQHSCNDPNVLVRDSTLTMGGGTATATVASSCTTVILLVINYVQGLF